MKPALCIVTANACDLLAGVALANAARRLGEVAIAPVVHRKMKRQLADAYEANPFRIAIVSGDAIELRDPVSGHCESMGFDAAVACLTDSLDADSDDYTDAAAERFADAFYAKVTA